MNFSKFFSILSLVAFGALAYFGYPIVKNRYFSDAEKTTEIQDPQTGSQPSSKDPLDAERQNGGGLAETDAEDATRMKPIGDTVREPSLLKITALDCDSECSAFVRDEKNMEYCRQTCGLAIPKETSAEGCDGLDGLEQDYCWKDLAASKKNFEICGQIRDGGIKKTCQNRITEEILDSVAGN